MFKLREIPISKWLIVTSVLLSTVALHGQSLDSLRLRPDNRAKVDAYQRLATEMEPHRKVLQILDEAYRIAVDLKYSSGQAQNRWLAGEVAFQLKRWDASKEAYESALRIYQQDENVPREISAYERIALVESKAGHYTLAAQYIQKASLLKERQATTQAQETITSLQQQDTAMQKEMAVQQVEIQGLNVEKSRALEQLQAQRQLSLEQQLEMARLLRERDSLELDRLGLEYDNLSQELSLEKAQRRNTWTLIGAILVGLLSLLFWQRLRIGQVRKNVQLERQRAAYLKQVNDLKDQFLANTSHELKTPLNGIIGLAESLLDEDTWADRNERDHNIELIVNSGRRLSNLVNDLLDFSKIRNNALELNPVSIDLHALVDVVVRIYRYMVKDKPLEVRNLIGKEMPAVLADEDRLQQILHNLIGNAVKFTEKGTIDVTARILDAGWVEIAVTDTGIGIPEDKQQSIFEAFVQGDGSTTRSHTGTGLGLAIARNLIELQQGSLKMESTPGLGSTFSFTLPISREAPVPLQVSMPVARPISFNQEVDEGKETSISRQMQNEDVFRILIVDDEPVNQQVLKNHLAREKYEMHFASSGAQALECLHQGIHFDLILLDIMMPQMSGYEVCQKIREEYLPAELPVILVTAKNRVEDLVTGLEQGANDYLAKPFTKGELLARIRTHLNLNHIHAVTNRFVPSHFLRALGYQTIVDVKLGDNVLREVTVLFSDIRDYTTLAESMSPSDTFHFVQAFSARMGPIIARHGGFVHQYLGDGIMAIFLEGPEKAIQAAIEMQLSLAEYNEQRQKVGRSALRLGIGLHTGPLIMGVIGDQMRSDAATISDTVNSASRMEGLTKDYRARILISAPTVTALPNREAFAMRFLGEVKVKGKQKKLGVFECMDADPPDLLRAKQANLNQFNRAMELYAEGDMNSVRKLLEELLAANPSDLTIRHIMDSLPVEMV